MCVVHNVHLLLVPIRSCDRWGGGERNLVIFVVLTLFAEYKKLVVMDVAVFLVFWIECHKFEFCDVCYRH